jgi:RNA polymerase sigma-B factor
MPETVVAPHEAATAPSPTPRAREDAVLFLRYRRTRDADSRRALVERYLPLAKHLAARYRRGDEYDDLVQVASFALLKAIDRYEPERGLAFATFAVPTIVGELKRYFRDHGWVVRVPRGLHDRSMQVQRASEQLTTSLGRSPTAAEIAQTLECSVESVLEALQTASAQRPDWLDAPLGSGDDEHEHSRGASEDVGYELAEASATVAPLLARLGAREREIVRLRFEQDLTQSEIAAVFGISQMQVSRILRRTIAQLQLLAAA